MAGASASGAVGGGGGDAGAGPTGGASSPAGGANSSGSGGIGGELGSGGSANAAGSSEGGSAASPSGSGGDNAGAATTGGSDSGSSGSDSGSGGDSAQGGGGTGGDPGVAIPPCDIYAEGGVPCVGAYSTVRLLSSTYGGPLYQVRRGGPDPNPGEGGVTQDIGALANGFGDAAAQDQFCGDELCTVAILYDQSGRENHLTVAPTNCYGGDYYEADAKRRQLTVGGQPVYALRTDGGEGYRNNDAVGTAEGEAAQGVYSVMDGTDVGEECCWDFGTASRDNCLTPSGSMHALFFGIGYWGSGQGAGPWFMADFSSGVWSGGTAESSFVNPNNPSLSVPYAFGILKSEATNYALRMGDATSGDLITAWDGGIPFENLSLLGGIILGTTGDGTSVSPGTFYEGAITAGRPSDEIDAAVFRSVRALGYGR